MRGGKIILVIGTALLVGALAVVGIGTAFAWGPWTPGPGPFGAGTPGAGPDSTGGYGPGWMMGGYGPGGTTSGYGPGGMMGGYGYGGMMGGFGPGWVMGGWYGQNSPNQGAPISMDAAVQNVQAYVDHTGNKDLAIDELMEFQNNFYAIVKEQSTGLGAFELLVNKHTGYVFPEYGPNMMWNTKYGMMGGWLTASGDTSNGTMTITAEQARAAADQWLGQYRPGSTTETPDQFYGYYTIHILKDSKITGMLSVNGYTGQVWYHTWHGDFIQMKELGR